MIVVDRKPVPLYEITCHECGSTFRYKASEVFLQHIDCPVCGISLWANASTPVAYEQTEEEE